MRLEMQMKVAENLRYLRNVFGRTQTEVADGLHMCRSTYALFESGKKVPGADTILDLAEYYDVRVDTVLQSGKEKYINNIHISDDSKNQILHLINTYYLLSPHGQGRLIERAATLLEAETQEELKKETEKNGASHL